MKFKSVGKNLIHELNPYYKLPIGDLVAEEIEIPLFLKSIQTVFTFHKNARYSIIEVAPSKITPLTNFVYNYRLKNAKKLLDRYVEKNIDPFRPCILNYRDQFSQVVCPPILEMHGGKMVLCDGTHRVYTSIKNRFKTISCLLVENVKIKLPGDVNTWENMTLRKNEVPVNDNFINFKPENLTGYTWLFNNEYNWLKITGDHKKILDIFTKQNKKH